MDVESGSGIVEAERLIISYWPLLLLLCVVDLEDPERAVARVLAEVVMWRCNKIRDRLVLEFGDSGESDPRCDVAKSDAAVGNGS
jgi:hypothetical protein